MSQQTYLQCNADAFERECWAWKRRQRTTEPILNRVLPSENAS
jgi:hypothetical protein